MTTKEKAIELLEPKKETSSKKLAKKVRIKLYTMGTVYVSRSQARRVLAGLEKFETIILDFDKVPTIGQGFADEIFRVFQKKHPRKEIVPANTNEAVQFMIDRVEKNEI